MHFAFLCILLQFSICPIRSAETEAHCKRKLIASRSKSIFSSMKFVRRQHDRKFNNYCRFAAAIERCPAPRDTLFIVIECPIVSCSASAPFSFQRRAKYCDRLHNGGNDRNLISHRGDHRQCDAERCCEFAINSPIERAL